MAPAARRVTVATRARGSLLWTTGTSCAVAGISRSRKKQTACHNRALSRQSRDETPAPGQALIRDRLSFMRFLGLDLADTVPDANTIWTFREALTRAQLAGKPAIEALFERLDVALSAAGFWR